MLCDYLKYILNPWEKVSEEDECALVGDVDVADCRVDEGGYNFSKSSM
jgi:hypothetical protein